MSFQDFDALRLEVAEHLDRDQDARVDSFIRLAESRHRREIRIRQMLVREALPIDGRYVQLPEGYLEARQLRILTDPLTVPVPASQDQMNDKRRSTSGKPRFFTVHGGEIEFDVEPDETYPGELSFYRELTPLSESSPTNSLLEIAPDVYLYAALSASAPFLMNDERVQMWESLYAQGRDGLNERERAGRRIGRLATTVPGRRP